MKKQKLALAMVSWWVATSAGALAQTPAAKPKGTPLELVEVSGSVERPNVGGNALGFTLRVPKGARPSPAFLGHNRGYGLDLDATRRITVSVWRLTSQGNLDPIIAYKANTYGGLGSKQELQKGTYLAVLNPMDALQTVFLFKRISKDEHIEIECTGPPSHIETLKESCASFKATSPTSGDVESVSGTGGSGVSTSGAAAAPANAPSRLTPEQESSLRGDLEKMIGSDRTTRRAAVFAMFKGGMYCDKIKKKFGFEGKCQFGRPSTLIMPASDNPLVGDYKLDFDGMTFQLKQAVADFKPEYDKEGFRKVAAGVFEAKWGPGQIDPGNPDRMVWAGKGGTMTLEYVGDHWQMHDVMLTE